MHDSLLLLIRNTTKIVSFTLMVSLLGITKQLYFSYFFCWVLFHFGVMKILLMSNLKMVLHGYLSLVYLDRECTLKVHSLDDNIWTTETGYGASFMKTKKIILLVN